MKKIKILYGLILVLALMACSKEDSPVGPDPDPTVSENKPPSAFELIEFSNGATKVDIFPTFYWRSAIDPDGDAITYDLLLDTQADPTTVFASNLTTTSFKVTERLHLTTSYHWKVVASDNKGRSVTSSTNIFTTRSLNFPTEPVTTAAFPKGVSGHTNTVFQNSLWVIGGTTESNRLNTVWYSGNGSNWLEPSLLLVPFSARTGHTTAVFDNKLWIIGGYDGFEKNDVWYSEDGATWVRATAAADFSPRAGHSTAVFDNKLWVIGGFTLGGNSNDVWYSNNGVSWELATREAAFSKRDSQTTVVFDNKLWIIGGYDGFEKNDVWYSSDGATWVRATAAADFSPRYDHTTVVYDDKLWVIGGFDGALKNDLWYSSDGIVWTQATGAAPFSARDGHATVVYNDKIWVIGGLDGTYTNDVWSLD